jgi:hypothetical protein
LHQESECRKTGFIDNASLEISQVNQKDYGIGQQYHGKAKAVQGKTHKAKTEVEVLGSFRIKRS